jgi:ribonuclease P protein component
VGRSFGPNSRLRKKSDIERCQKGGEKLHARHFLILVLPSPTGQSRLATAVTTKLEKRSVVRNLIKRRIREVFRAARADFTKAIDMVVIARKGIQSCAYADYQREIVGALAAKGFLKRRNAGAE